jgi:hypothetical protein
MERKVILALPVSDEGLLRDFVKQCLSANVDLIAIFGQEAPRFHDEIDWLIIELEADSTCWPTTTLHYDETWDDVVKFAAEWPTEPPSGVTVLHL